MTQSHRQYPAALTFPGSMAVESASIRPLTVPAAAAAEDVAAMAAAVVVATVEATAVDREVVSVEAPRSIARLLIQHSRIWWRRPRYASTGGFMTSRIALTCLPGYGQQGGGGWGPSGGQQQGGYAPRGGYGGQQGGYGGQQDGQGGGQQW